MPVPTFVDAEPNPFRAAATERLRETIDELESLRVPGAPEHILQLAIGTAHREHADGSPQTTLEQSRYSMFVGFSIIKDKEVKAPLFTSIEKVRASKYMRSSGFVDDADAAKLVLERFPDDPETRALIMFRHGMIAAAKLIKERQAEA